MIKALLYALLLPNGYLKHSVQFQERFLSIHHPKPLHGRYPNEQAEIRARQACLCKAAWTRSCLIPSQSHVSRPVRWDSDHVVVLDDELREIALEIVRNHALEKVAIGLDFFDASINRLSV